MSAASSPESDEGPPSPLAPLPGWTAPAVNHPEASESNSAAACSTEAARSFDGACASTAGASTAGASTADDSSAMGPSSADTSAPSGTSSTVDASSTVGTWPLLRASAVPGVVPGAGGTTSSGVRLPSPGPAVLGSPDPAGSAAGAGAATGAATSPRDVNLGRPVWSNPEVRTPLDSDRRGATTARRERHRDRQAAEGRREARAERDRAYMGGGMVGRPGETAETR